MDVVEEESLTSLVQRLGSAASEALLESDHHVFSVPGIDGIIGYRLQSNFAITFGDPLCPVEQAPQLAAAFHQFCEENKIHVIYMITSLKFADWVSQHLKFVKIEVGEELNFNPQVDVTLGHQKQKLRNYLNHATNEGLEVHEYQTRDEKLEHEIEQVGKRWLKGRKGPQIHLGTLDFFKDRHGKRWFYVQQRDQILGMAMLSRRDYYGGWFLKFLMSVPDSPRGCSDLLMITILETLRKEGCHFLTYGMVPAKQLGEINGLGKLSTTLAKFTFNLIKKIFHLDQRKQFWQKFDPKTERSFVLFSNHTISLLEIHALIKALKIDITVL